MLERKSTRVACLIFNIVLLGGLAALVMTGTGCGDDAGAVPDAGVVTPMPDGDVTRFDTGIEGDAGPPLPTALLSRPSKSGTIDISEDDSIVAMVNPEDDSLSVFTTADNNRIARVTTGGEPSAVVLHPTGTIAFVANRADATVVRIDDVNTASPRIVATVEVGSEPTGLALSPLGRTLFVAEHGEGRVAVIDTSTMAVTAAIENPTNPFAISVTNDGDMDEGDELVVIPEFFGVPNGVEGTDTSRAGLVRIYSTGDLSPQSPITFMPIDSGFAPMGGANVQTSPNQLGPVAIQGTKIYVPSISVSPAAPIAFNLNIQPVVYVGDLATASEDRNPGGTTNLAALVRDEAPSGVQPLFLADLSDIAFIGAGGVAYAVSRGADVMQRLVYAPGSVTPGSDRNLQIELGTPPAGATAGCQAPTGLAISHEAPFAYVNCWVTRNLGVVDLSMQALVTTVEASAPPTGEEAAEQRGRRFFFTGRGRWSNNGWSSCASCHPGGLTDNVTWRFAAGPRQSTSLDGSFSHGPGPQKHRIFNWTGIFDEVHDFERNTRGTSGGLGAVTTGDCGNLAGETQLMLGANLGQPVREVQATGCTDDWDDVEAYMKTIRPPRGRRFLDAASVARGAALFGMPNAGENNGGCVACHGGAGWTASRRFWTPSSANNAALLTAPFTRPAAWPAVWNAHTTQIGTQPLSTDMTMGAAGPEEVACVIRNVGTFGVPGDDAATAALEVRVNAARAQGAGGFNVPSLYGLQVGAPYLHHGQARTLEELFNDPRWQAHLTAANPVFLTTGDAEQQKRDLIAYLLSIDATTPEQPLPAGFDGCLPSFP